MDFDTLNNFDFYTLMIFRFRFRASSNVEGHESNSFVMLLPSDVFAASKFVSSVSLEIN